MKLNRKGEEEGEGEVTLEKSFEVVGGHRGTAIAPAYMHPKNPIKKSNPK